MEVEAKLKELGLVLPAPTKTPPGLVLPFSWVRVRGDRAHVSGHVALKPDGSIAEPLGKVGVDVSEAEAYESARLVALAILAASNASWATWTASWRGSGSSVWSTPRPASTG